MTGEQAFKSLPSNKYCSSRVLTHKGTSSLVSGQTNRPFSKRLYSRMNPLWCQKSSLGLSRPRLVNTNKRALNGSSDNVSCTAIDRPSICLRKSTGSHAIYTRVWTSRLSMRLFIYLAQPALNEFCRHSERK